MKIQMGFQKKILNYTKRNVNFIVLQTNQLVDKTEN